MRTWNRDLGEASRGSRGRWDRISGRFRFRTYAAESALLVAVAVATLWLPKPVPAGIYGIGLVAGAALALQGIAMILVYRINRIINFAQASYGLAAAMMFSTLVQYRSLLRWIEPICPSDCLTNPTAIKIGYWVSLALTLGFVMLLGWLTQVLVVRRMATAPPLLLTVATIFVGFFVVAIASLLSSTLVPSELQERGGPPPGAVPAEPPWDFALRWGGATFHAVDLLTVVVTLTALVGLFIYLRWSATGNAIRASADNPDRAETLGINVQRVTARAWVIAAAIAGAGGLLVAMSQGAAAAFGNSSIEVRILAIAIVAHLTSFPLVVLAGIVMGIVQQAMQWSFGSTLLLDGSLFILMAIVLLARSRKRGRSDSAREAEWRSATEIRPIPRELRSVPPVKKWTRIAIGVIALVLLSFPWLMSPSNTNLAAAVLTYAMIGLSLLVLTGWAGQISLGQVAFAAIGAYVAAVLHLPFLLALPVGGLAGAGVALVVGVPALRLRGLNLAVITLAFHQAVVAVGLNPSYLGRFLPESLARPSLLGMNFDDERVFYYFVLVAAAGVTIAVTGMRRTRTARALLATRDNEEAAQAFGINLTRARVGAFAVSGFIAAFAGVVLAYHQTGVQPAAFGVDLSRVIFLHSVIGGLGTVVGPLIGLAYYAIPLLFQLPLLMGVLMSGPGGLLLLLFSPGGLAQLFFDLRDAWLRRVARRFRIVVPSLVADIASDPKKERAPLAAKTRSVAGQAFVPSRYELPRQWAIGARSRDGSSKGHSFGDRTEPHPVPGGGGA